MMERPSLHQNGILKRSSFRAGPDLRSAVMDTINRFQATEIHIDQCRKTTPQPDLTSSTRRWRPPQVAPNDTTLVMLSP